MSCSSPLSPLTRLFCCALLLTAVIGCSPSSSSSSGQASQPQANAGGGSSQVDVAAAATDEDPLVLARVYLDACRSRDAATAIQCVPEAARAGLQRLLAIGYPPFPASYKLEVESKDADGTTHIHMVGQSLRFKMRSENDRWWIDI